MIDPDSEEKLLETVKAAGAIQLDFWPGGDKAKENEDSGALKIEQKSDGSFVTEADHASNNLIVNTLQELFPGDGIYSEEIPPSEKVGEMTRVWIIDPLDGTQSFIDGKDDFSILLALCVDKKPQYAIMYFPARNVLGVAEKGKGVKLNGEPIKVSTASEPRKDSVYIRHFEPPTLDCIYGPWMDSGMAFLNVCQGAFDGSVMRIVSHQEWDLAAPALFVEESGGKISDGTGAPIEFHAGPIKYKYFVASNGIVHQKLLGLIPEEGLIPEG